MGKLILEEFKLQQNLYKVFDMKTILFKSV